MPLGPRHGPRCGRGVGRWPARRAAGESLVLQLRPGSASPFDKADHIDALDLALAQLPDGERGQVLVRADTGDCSKAFLHHITDTGLEYSIGFPALETVKTAVEQVPAQAWRAAVDGDGQPREGAQVAELTAWLPDPTTKASRPGPRDWPEGMRVIARRERPHPGAQLRLTDADGWRITCFATNTRGPGWTLATLEVRHRQRARCEDRIRALKDTGLRNLPLHGYDQDQIWLEIVALAADLLTWTQTPGLAPDHGGTPLGTQTPAATDPARRRTHHPQRPPPPAATTPRLALEPPHRHRLGRSPARLTTQVPPHRRGPPKNRRTQRRRPPMHSTGNTRHQAPTPTDTAHTPVRRNIEARACR